jgi:hypothetical protein
MGRIIMQKVTRLFIVFLFFGLVVAAQAQAQENMTTLVKHLYNGNWPDATEISKFKDQLLYTHAMEAYFMTLPALNIIGMHDGSEAQFGGGYNVLPIWKDRMYAKAQVPTMKASSGGVADMTMEGSDMGRMMRPDMMPPVGVMGGMSPRKGSVMASLQYMHMRMDGNRSGTDSLGTGTVLSKFPVAPLNMDMDMMMGGAMYGITNELSIIAMIPYIWKSMDHVTRTGVKFTTESEGFGDLRIVGGYDFWKPPNHTIKLSVGVGFPTGSINERDDTPAGADQILPYPMQTGSGTYDLLSGVLYSGRNQNWSWGGQLNVTARLGENDKDYTLGNVYSASVWGAHIWTSWLSISVRAIGESIENIDGADPRLDPRQVSTADPNRRAGDFISAGLGLNFLAPPGLLYGTRLGIEGVVPLYQDLDGPQLERDYTIAIRLSKTF